MFIRKASFDDLPVINEIYAHARAQMKLDGNPTQWGDVKPYKYDTESDILNGNLYLIFSDSNEAAGVFALIKGPDETYGYIENGSWSLDGPYSVIHRIAGNGKMKGIFRTALEFASLKTSYIRIDTHQNNGRMQHLLLSNGFRRCGIIYLKDGNPRIAFDRVFADS